VMGVEGGREKEVLGVVGSALLESVVVVVGVFPRLVSRANDHLDVVGAWGAFAVSIPLAVAVAPVVDLASHREQTESVVRPYHALKNRTPI
jgi:hypothetical protein